jgi:hypothetical protein
MGQPLPRWCSFPQDLWYRWSAGPTERRCIRTFFTSFKVRVGYMRRALIATITPYKAPFQMSVNPPDDIAISPRLLIPSESTDEAGSSPVALHISPRAVIHLEFCELSVGYACTRIMRQFQRGEQTVSVIPDRPCQQTSPGPPARAPKLSVRGPCR